MKDGLSNWRLAVSRILIFAFCFGSLAIYPQIRDGKGAGVKIVSELPSKEKRWALIIGVDNYQKDISPLYGTVNDAKALRDTLIKHAGFSEDQIILMTTDSDDYDLIPTRANIILQLHKLQRVVPEDGLILFSFSGHGVSIGEDAFIVPADGRIFQSATLMREVSIDVLRIKRAIQDTKVKQVIMFLDACRNDPVKGKGDIDNNLTTAYKQGFSFETKNQNIEAYATLYATSFGDRAYEFFDKKTGKHRGYFSYAIEEGLKGKAANDKGEITLASLVRYIGDTVKESVRINLNERQIPYLDIGGSFTNSDLVIAVTEKNTSIKTNQSSEKTNEQTYWQEIIKINSISGYERYLTENPNGEFSKFAKLRLGNLKWANINSLARTFLKYDFVSSPSEDLLRYSTKEKYGFLDTSGREIIPAKFDYANSFSEGFAVVGLISGKKDCGGETVDTLSYGFINKSGIKIVPLNYQYAYDFSEGLAGVVRGKLGFINKSKKAIIEYKYDFEFDPDYYFTNCDEAVPESSLFKNGLALVSKKGGNKIENFYGFIDKTGIAVIPILYDSAKNFSEGLAVVCKDRKCGYINETGNSKIPLKFDSANSFYQGIAIVKLENKWHLINKEGKIINTLDTNYHWVYEYSNGLAKVQIGRGFDSDPRKFGFVDTTGKTVIPVRYENVWCNAFEDKGFIGIMLNGKKGFVDIYGNEFFDF